MKKIIKKYIYDDLCKLKHNKRMSFNETRVLQKNIIRLINISKELEGILNSNKELYDLFERHNDIKKQDLKDFLFSIDPFDFETLVAKLFVKMGYDVEKTKKSNDLGVDIIAKGVVGLTSVKEVIQVKRQKNNIHRPVLDQLRGVIPIHNATTGCIVTLSDFSKNCYKLAPENIKLINGNKLIDLLFEYQVGFKAVSLEVYSIDYEYFENILE